MNKKLSALILCIAVLFQTWVPLPLVYADTTTEDLLNADASMINLAVQASPAINDLNSVPTGTYTFPDKGIQNGSSITWSFLDSTRGTVQGNQITINKVNSTGNIPIEVEAKLTLENKSITKDFTLYCQPTLQDEQFGSYVSNAINGTSNNSIMSFDKPTTKTFRIYIKPHEYGKLEWRFWSSNTVCSTGISVANTLGGKWQITSAYIADGGTACDGSILPNTSTSVKYNNNTYKNVLPGERFWSDPVWFTIPKGHYLAFTWTVKVDTTGQVIPYTYDSMVNAYNALGEVTNQITKKNFILSPDCVMPNLFAYKKEGVKRIGFLGDSITQGSATHKNKYEFWAAKIALSLDSNKYSIWNIGLGWGRAHDLVKEDSAWLYEAMQLDEVNICLGVNDIGSEKTTADQIISYISTIITKLKQNNPEVKINLFTLPTFNFVSKNEITWRALNDKIKNNPPEGVDRVFDIASILSRPAPNDNMVQRLYMCGDAHPNALAGTEVAKQYLIWYNKTVRLTLNIPNEATVQGATSGKRYSLGTVITITASDNNTLPFKYWVDENNNIVSKDKTYKFIIKKDTNLAPVYGN